MEFINFINSCSGQCPWLSMSADGINWRSFIVKRLSDRNRRETNSFNEIINQSLYSAIPNLNLVDNPSQNPAYGSLFRIASRNSSIQLIIQFKNCDFPLWMAFVFFIRRNQHVIVYCRCFAFLQITVYLTRLMNWRHWTWSCQWKMSSCDREVQLHQMERVQPQPQKYRNSRVNCWHNKSSSLICTSEKAKMHKWSSI